MSASSHQCKNTVGSEPTFGQTRDMSPSSRGPSRSTSRSPSPPPSKCKDATVNIATDETSRKKPKKAKSKKLKKDKKDKSEKKKAKKESKSKSKKKKSKGDLDVEDKSDHGPGFNLNTDIKAGHLFSIKKKHYFIYIYI